MDDILMVDDLVVGQQRPPESSSDFHHHQEEEMDGDGAIMSALYLESSFLMLLFIAGLLANVPVLILYFRSKHIRSITDKFLLNLLLADMASVILLFPVILSSFVQTSSTSLGRNHQQLSQNITSESGEDDGNHMGYEYWKWNCVLSNGILAGLATASVLAALEIAMERYLAVVKPLHYHKLLTTASIFVTSIIGGAISIVTAIIASVEPNFSLFPHCLQHQVQVQRQAHSRQQLEAFLSGHHHLNLNLNSTNGGESSTSSFIERPPPPRPTNGDLIWSLYSLASATFLFLIPVILMLYIYSKIWMEARRQRIKMSNQYKPYFLPVPSDHVVSTESEGRKIKQGRTFLPIIVKFRRLRVTRLDRAGRVAVIALVVTILCWSPYYFLKAYRAIQTLLTMYGYESHQNISSSSSSSHATYWSRTVVPLLLAALHPILSPLFYAYRYKRLRTEIFKWISSLCLISASDSNNGNNRWEGGNANKGGRGCFTSSAMHTNASSISGGGSPIIRQVIINQPLPPKMAGEVLTGQQQLDQPPPPPPPPCVVVVESYDEGIVEKQVNQGNSGDDDYSAPGEKCGGEENRSYTFQTPTSNICINIFSSEEDEEFDDEDRNGHGQNRALDGGETNNDHHHQEGDASSSSLPNAAGSSSTSTNSFVGGIVRVERSVGNFFNYLNVWVNSYSRRWLQHRESVTSTASFITLLSSKYHNKTHTVASV